MGVVLVPVEKPVSMEWIALIATVMIWLGVISFGIWLALDYIDLTTRIKIAEIGSPEPVALAEPVPTTVPPDRIVVPSIGLDVPLEVMDWEGTEEGGQKVEIWRLSGGHQSEELVLYLYWNGG